MLVWMDKPKRRPGDLIIDRYLPGADEDIRERARDALRAWARVRARIGERICAEQSTGAPAPDEDRRHNRATPKESD
jgi:hypothetical protein